MRRRPDEDAGLLYLPGDPVHQDLRQLLRQRHEGVPRLSRGAWRQLG